MVIKYKKYLKSLGWNVLLYSALGCFSLFFLVQYADIPVDFQKSLMVAKVFVSGILLFNGIGFSLKYINNRLVRTYPSFIQDKKMVIFFLVLSAFFIMITNYLLLVSIKFLIGSPHPFQVAAKGIRLLLVIFLAELFVVGLMMVVQFYKNISEMYRHTKELESSAAQTRYMALQSQLNPHFLFNSLNTLVSEIEYNPKKAMEFTRNLSDIYRYILNCQNHQLVSIQEEVGFIGKYIFLHQVRLGDCIMLDNQIPDSMLEHSIPPLTLQLLVENVIKHNVISPSKPMSISLMIEIREEREWLVISNPIHPKQGVPVSGKGLKNLSQRNMLLCRQDIVIEKTELFFTVKVPVYYEYE